MRRLLARYLIAVVSCAVAFALTNAFSAFLQPMRLFFLWVAVLVTAVVAGTGPALLAIALCSIASAYVIFAPLGSLAIYDVRDILRLTLFILFAGTISAAVGLRRRAELRTAELRDWLQTTLRSIGDAVIATDAHARVTFINPEGERLTGRTSAECLGKPLADVFVIEDESRGVQVESPVDRVLREGVVVGLANHTVIVRPDGTRIPIDDSAAPIRRPGGELAGVVLVFHDVSDARAHADAIQQSERRYRTLVEATPVPQAVWTATADGTIEWSDRWLAITGQSREDVERGAGMNVVNPADAARTWDKWQHAIATRTYYDDEIRVRVADGRERWFAIRAVPLLRHDGSVEQWVGAIADIHERRAIESASAFINRATDLLGSSLDYQKTLRNLARLCVPELGDWCSIDIAREGEPYERSIVEHSDPEKAELVLRLDRDYRAAPEVDPIVAVMASRRAQVLEDIPLPVLESLAHDERHLALIRQLELRSWIIAPMVARGRTLGTISVVTSGPSARRYNESDVPLVEELARRAAIAIDNARLYHDAEAASRAKDEFLATLSHELRTPLTAIVGWASMLRLGTVDKATESLAIETILRSAKSQGELIEDLLDLSGIVAGKLALDFQQVDLAAIAREVAVSLRPSADAKSIDLTFASSGNTSMRGDARRLRQILWNLGTNAVKFTPRGGRIAIRVDEAETNVRATVTDGGIGIAPEFLPHVWERFRQADSSTSRQHGGLGLGLAVVRHLVELHGGVAAVHSDGLGKGASFAVEFPRPVARTASLPDAVHGTEPVLRGRRLLVVDDERDSLTVLAAMLRQFGADVTTAASAAEAMRALDGHEVVITDIAMPGEDGYQFLARLRATRRVPVIAVSAIAGSDDRNRALAAGFADFVRKPVEPRQLAEAVAKQLA